LKIKHIAFYGTIIKVSIDVSSAMTLEVTLRDALIKVRAGFTDRLGSISLLGLLRNNEDGIDIAGMTFIELLYGMISFVSQYVESFIIRNLNSFFSSDSHRCKGSVILFIGDLIVDDHVMLIIDR